MKTEKFKCEKCGREFSSEEGLAMHDKAKHSERMKKETKKLPFKKIRNWGIFIIVIGLIIFGVSSLILSSIGSKTTINSSNLNFTAPTEPIHWHPQLTIMINGQKQDIPSNIGLGGSVHMPIHTHDSSGTIHMEEDNPTKESVTLGFFFQVWGRKLTKDCIFDYCTDKGNLTMFVNGKRNYDFQNYFMQDEDIISINYESFS